MYYSLIVQRQETRVYDQCEETFLRLIPGTFTEFNDVYGFDLETNTFSIFYDFADQHIEILERTLVKDTAYFEKIIGITIGGTWDAYAVNYFQRLVRSFIQRQSGYHAAPIK